MNLYPAPRSDIYTVIVSSGPYTHHVAFPAKSEEHAKRAAVERVKRFSDEYAGMPWEAAIANPGRQEIERGDAA